MHRRKPTHGPGPKKTWVGASGRERQEGIPGFSLHPGLNQEAHLTHMPILLVPLCAKPTLIFSKLTPGSQEVSTGGPVVQQALELSRTISFSCFARKTEGSPGDTVPYLPELGSTVCMTPPASRQLRALPWPEELLVVTLLIATLCGSTPVSSRARSSCPAHLLSQTGGDVSTKKLGLGCGSLNKSLLPLEPH